MKNKHFVSSSHSSEKVLLLGKHNLESKYKTSGHGYILTPHTQLILNTERSSMFLCYAKVRAYSDLSKINFSSQDYESRQFYAFILKVWLWTTFELKERPWIFFLLMLLYQNYCYKCKRFEKCARKIGKNHCFMRQQQCTESLIIKNCFSKVPTAENTVWALLTALHGEKLREFVSFWRLKHLTLNIFTQNCLYLTQSLITSVNISKSIYVHLAYHCALAQYTALLCSGRGVWSVWSSHWLLLIGKIASYFSTLSFLHCVRVLIKPISVMSPKYHHYWLSFN